MKLEPEGVPQDANVVTDFAPKRRRLEPDDPISSRLDRMDTDQERLVIQRDALKVGHERLRVQRAFRDVAH